MSDGPSATLQMDRRWRRAARCAENDASDPEEIRGEIEAALVGQWREGVPPDLVAALTRLFDGDRQGQLFEKLDCERIESLRRLTAGKEFGGLFVDCCLQVAAEGLDGVAALRAAAATALASWAARWCAQIFQHNFCVTDASRASMINDRIKKADSGCDFAKLAHDLLAGATRQSANRPAKQAGIDDGPGLPS